MLNSNKSKNFQIWKNAYSLAHSRERFSDPMIAIKEQKLLQELENNPELALAKIPNIDHMKTTDFGKTVVDFAILLRPIATKNDATRAKEKNIIHQLSDGKLIGLGYEMPRRSTDEPLLIPADIWTGKVDWKKDEVTGNGLQFVSVRVIRSELINSITQPADNTELEIVPPRGRPTVKPMIVEAYNELLHSNKINFSSPMTVCYSQIKRLLADKYPEDSARLSNLADETIRITISDLFKRDQQANKQ